MISETHIDLSIELNIFLQLKELTLDNIYFAVEKLLYQLEMFFQLVELLKVQPYAILNPVLEIKDHIQDAQELMPLLWDIQKMDQEQESDYHLDQEKLFQEIVELLLEL